MRGLSSAKSNNIIITIFLTTTCCAVENNYLRKMRKIYYPWRRRLCSRRSVGNTCALPRMGGRVWVSGAFKTWSIGQRSAGCCGCICRAHRNGINTKRLVRNITIYVRLCVCASVLFRLCNMAHTTTVASRYTYIECSLHTLRIGNLLLFRYMCLHRTRYYIVPAYPHTHAVRCLRLVCVCVS